MTLTAIDIDGETVAAGDTIAFTYGIPPVRVEGVLFERDGKLIMPTPDHNPKEATLRQIKINCGGFWKVQRHWDGCACGICAGKNKEGGE